MQMVLLGGAVVAWAALHSWLASTGMKTYAAAKLGAGASRGYRLGYNLISFISLAPVACLMWQVPDSTLYAIPAPANLGMRGIQALAAVLAMVTILQTDALHFAGLSQLMGRTGSGQLLQTGLYGVVRHPLYLLALIVLWFSPGMSANQLTVTVVLSAYLVVGAVLEERRLVQEFGKAYEDYRSRTPMLIPRLGRRH